MSEYVLENVNGKLFRFRDEQDLTRVLSNACDEPEQMAKLGKRGYWKTKSGKVPSVEVSDFIFLCLITFLKEHVDRIRSIYADLASREPIRGRPVMDAPWRITFDTNPDLCNLNCIMCEEHSHLSPLREERLRNRLPKRTMDIEVIEKVIEECVPNGLKEIIPSTMVRSFYHVYHQENYILFLG